MDTSDEGVEKKPQTENKESPSPTAENEQSKEIDTDIEERQYVVCPKCGEKIWL